MKNEDVVIVKLWGKEIGALGYASSETKVATFEYQDDFVKMEVEVSPLEVPIRVPRHTFSHISQRTFRGVPGFIADALPDKFGNQLIDQYFTDQGINSKDITTLDRLLYVGKRAMGALEFEPSESFDVNNSELQLDVKKLSELAELVISKKERFRKKLESSDRATALKLLRIGSSAGGARSKALVAVDKKGNLYDGTVNHDFKCRYYILKFDSSSNKDRDSSDPKGTPRIEYIYNLIAKKCGINIPDVNYIENGDDFHFLIERFDRVRKKSNDFKMDKVHYVSWCGIAHAHRDEVGAYSYEQLVMTARELKLGQDSITELFKRAVFNVVGKNQDDHTKNFGFLMNRNAEWSLSPAFDLTFSYDPEGKWTKVHQIRLNKKQDDFTLQDIIEFGEYCNLKKAKSKEILDQTVNAFEQFDDLADEYRVPKELKKTVSGNIRRNIN